MATVEPSAGGGTSGSNRWGKAVYGVLAAVTAATGLYWLVAAEAWAMQLHGALFLAFGVAAAVFIWRWRDPATAPDAPPYADAVLKAGAIASVIWVWLAFWPV